MDSAAVAIRQLPTSALSPTGPHIQVMSMPCISYVNSVRICICNCICIFMHSFESSLQATSDHSLSNLHIQVMSMPCISDGNYLFSLRLRVQHCPIKWNAKYPSNPLAHCCAIFLCYVGGEIDFTQLDNKLDFLNTFIQVASIYCFLSMYKWCQSL